MPMNMPSFSEVGRDTWDRAWASHHLNEIERQTNMLTIHTARISPTPEGCELIDTICARLQAMKGEQAEREAA
jgi:hypothetical protein